MRRPVLSSICHFGQAAAICLAKIRRNMLGMLRPYVRVRQECVGLDTLHVVAKIKLGLLTRRHTAEYFGNFCVREQASRGVVVLYLFQVTTL